MSGSGGQLSPSLPLILSTEKPLLPSYHPEDCCTSAPLKRIVFTFIRSLATSCLPSHSSVHSASFSSHESTPSSPDLLGLKQHSEASRQLPGWLPAGTGWRQMRLQVLFIQPPRRAPATCCLNFVCKFLFSFKGGMEARRQGGNVIDNLIKPQDR